MTAKQTIAIIGKPGKELYTLCQTLAKGNYRLLVCGDDQKNLHATALALGAGSSTAEVAIYDCVVEACWEADSIILGSTAAEEPVTATLIKEVVNQKLVITNSPAGEGSGKKQQAEAGTDDSIGSPLPYSKLVHLIFERLSQEPSPVLGSKAMVLSSRMDEASLEAVSGLLKDGGVEVVDGKHLGTKVVSEPAFAVVDVMVAGGSVRNSK